MFLRAEQGLQRLFVMAGEAIDYLRGGVALAQGIKSKIGMTAFRTSSPTGMSIRVDSRDFLVLAADFAEGFEPEGGDIVRYKGQDYVVVSPAGEPCWEWHGRHTHSVMRIHAVHDGVAQESSSAGE